METAQHNRIVNFIWSIADDVLRDLYVRGKYRDVILPMVVLRRFDAVLEPTKQEVLERKSWLDESGIVEQEQPLCAAAKQPFYNTSPFRLRDLKSRRSRQKRARGCPQGAPRPVRTFRRNRGLGLGDSGPWRSNRCDRCPPGPWGGKRADVTTPWGAVVEFRDGKAIRMSDYLDPNEALEAAGLSE